MSTRYQSTHLKTVLSDQGRKQSWLAARAGISPRLLAYIVSGERTASAEVATQIAAVLGVPLFFVFATTDVVDGDSTTEAAA